MALGKLLSLVLVPHLQYGDPNIDFDLQVCCKEDNQIMYVKQFEYQKHYKNVKDDDGDYDDV